MAAGDTYRILRYLMGILRPLSGDVATGAVRAAAVSGQITVPVNSMLIPVIESAAGGRQLVRDLVYRTSAETVVPASGALIPVASLIGGKRHDLPDGATLRWDPPLLGLTETATASGAITGGADSIISSPGAVRRILPSDSTVPSAIELVKTHADHLPAILVSNAGFDTSDWNLGDDFTNADRWIIYTCVGKKVTGDIGEVQQGLAIQDAIRTYLSLRTSFFGEVFSDAIEVRSGRFLGNVRGQTFRIYESRVWTGYRDCRTEHRSMEAGDFNHWLKTQYDFLTATPAPLPVVEGALYPQGQSFSTAFDEDSFTSGGEPGGGD
jgi:hypothetical protein